MQFQVEKSYIVRGEITPDEAAEAVVRAAQDYTQLPEITVNLTRALGGKVEAVVRCTDISIIGSPANEDAPAADQF